MKYQTVISKLREAQKEIPELLAKMGQEKHPSKIAALAERIEELRSIDGTVEILNNLQLQAIK